MFTKAWYVLWVSRLDIATNIQWEILFYGIIVRTQSAVREIFVLVYIENIESLYSEAPISINLGVMVITVEWAFHQHTNINLSVIGNILNERLSGKKPFICRYKLNLLFWLRILSQYTWLSSRESTSSIKWRELKLVPQVCNIGSSQLS
jgi:hypothetical protein